MTRPTDQISFCFTTVKMWKCTNMSNCMIFFCFKHVVLYFYIKGLYLSDSRLQFVQQDVQCHIQLKFHEDITEIIFAENICKSTFIGAFKHLYAYIKQN